MSEPNTMLYFYNFDESRSITDEPDPRGLSVVVNEHGITIHAFEGESLIGTKEMSFESWWEKAVGR